MSIFVLPVKAPQPKTKNIIPISLLFATFLALLALLQLFSFEDLPHHLADIGIPTPITPFVASLIVTTEVFALPFALRLTLSPAFRFFSMVSGWIAGVTLLYIAIVENIYASTQLSAVFGTTLPLPVGTWSICAALALLVLAGWTSWGLFPYRLKK